MFGYRCFFSCSWQSQDSGLQGCEIQCLCQRELKSHSPLVQPQKLVASETCKLKCSDLKQVTYQLLTPNSAEMSKPSAIVVLLSCVVSSSKCSFIDLKLYRSTQQITELAVLQQDAVKHLRNNASFDKLFSACNLEVALDLCFHYGNAKLELFVFWGAEVQTQAPDWEPMSSSFFHFRVLSCYRQVKSLMRPGLWTYETCVLKTKAITVSK